MPDHQIGYIMLLSIGLTDSIYCVKTIDGGNTWNIISTFSTSDYPMNNSLKYVDQNSGFFNTSHDFYKTIDGGYTWQLQYTFPNDFVAFQPISTDTVIAVTQYYDIWKSVNGGQSWIPSTTPVHSPMFDICFSNDTCYIFGGNGINSGFVIRSSDKGDSWTLAYNDNDTYYKVNSSSGKIVFACGDNGAVITNDKLFTSVTEIDSRNFNIYPNPVSDRLKLNISTNNFEYKIRDSVGNIVLEGKDSNSIQTEDLSNGFYTIDINSALGRLSISFIVMHLQ
jgi:hypothetical protein